MFHYRAWQAKQTNQPMSPVDLSCDHLSENDVFVRIAGCGVCHTDLGFLYEGIPTVKPFPLVLGHEISGIVKAAGAKYSNLVGKAVIVPAVLPCGDCDLCKKGRSNICRQQKMPGNHIEGGFASHIVVPGRYLCPVEVADENAQFGRSGVRLAELSVIADAVTTPFQAIKNAGLSKGDVTIFIGVGGVGGFGVQIAKALGATVIAIDINQKKLDALANYGADVTYNPQQLEAKALKNALRNFVRENNLSPFEWKIFETSGSVAGQELAFSLLTFGATLSVVGFTMAKIQLRLGNLMAYDARAIGNWGCKPEYYPDALEMVHAGQIQLQHFVERLPLSEINAVFERVHSGEMQKRPVLIPDFE